MSFADFGKRPGWAAEQRRKAAQERQRIQREASAAVMDMHRTGSTSARPDEDPVEAMMRTRRETNAEILAMNARTLEDHRRSRESQLRRWRSAVLGYWD